jgi:Hint domain
MAAYGLFNSYATQYNICGLLKDGSSVAGYFVVQNNPNNPGVDNSVSLLAENIKVNGKQLGETFTYTYGVSGTPDTVFSVDASRSLGTSTGGFTTYMYDIISMGVNNFTGPPPGNLTYSGIAVLSLEFNTKISETTGVITAKLTNSAGAELGTLNYDQIDYNADIGDVSVSYASAFNTSITTLRATASTIICYAKGTFIATARGMVSVEKLKIGDLILTISGKYEPLKWLGFRTVDCKRHPNQEDAHPVRIAKDAFGPNQPVRDLYLSPLHSVYVDGILIPAIDLVNGSTVTQEVRSKITYFHVELPTHNAIYAEGLTAESYLDDNNRDFFVDKTTGQVVNMNAHFAEKQFTDMTSAEIWAAKGFAKVMRDGPQVDAVRTRLNRQHSHQETRSDTLMAA